MQDSRKQESSKKKSFMKVKAVTFQIQTEKQDPKQDGNQDETKTCKSHQKEKICPGVGLIYHPTVMDHDVIELRKT